MTEDEDPPYPVQDDDDPITWLLTDYRDCRRAELDGWQTEPYRLNWQFDEWATQRFPTDPNYEHKQPPGVRLVNVGIKNIYAITLVDGRYVLLEDGQFICYRGASPIDVIEMPFGFDPNPMP